MRFVLGLLLAASFPVCALAGEVPDPMAPEKTASYDWVRPQADFVRREEMVPMRDGTRLYTVIVYKKGTADAPILLSRTPYDASAATSRIRSQSVVDVVPIADKEFVEDGYIRVYQDVRGLHKSEGDYVMARPLRGPLNQTGIDHATDAYDTIAWLTHNVPQTNGKVAMIGSSYLGMTTLMATADPHPALKAVVPQSPMVDGWMGDDWFHNGAFRPFGYDYALSQTVKEGGNGGVASGDGDEYDNYLKGGSAGDYARMWGVDQLPTLRKMLGHPAYDAYWQEQALDKVIARKAPTVPMLLVVGQWDQEDSYGAPAVFRALRKLDPEGKMVHIAIGPWRHSGVNYDGSSLGALKFAGDTAREFRTRWMKPFIDCHVKTHPKPCAMPTAVTYATGADRWEETATWPAGTERALYLDAAGSAGFARPAMAARTSYVSDPADPVPSAPRPIKLDGDAWKTWLVQDQRFLGQRRDVAAFVTPPLTEAVHVRGAPRVELFAATTGRDSDFVVKLIDVYPAQGGGEGMSGYQLPIGIEIFRGRYAESFSNPRPLVPGQTTRFGWSLPNVNHVFKPGHRIMVQVQSSLFPVYDRNPQSWVANIFDAKPGDYIATTQTVMTGGKTASAVWLPVAQP